jgi:hypothetical protein
MTPATRLCTDTISFGLHLQAVWRIPSSGPYGRGKYGFTGAVVRAESPEFLLGPF